MLALRLARGAGPWALGLRLLLAVAAAGVGFLLLAALGHAVGHPGSGGASALRLACCALPLAATVQLAVAVARTDPTVRSRSGLTAAGLGPARVPVLAAVSTAIAGLLGSVLALLVFLHLRGDVSGLPFDGAAAEALAAERPLPLAAALTLLVLVPAAAAGASALALRPPSAPPPATPPEPRGDGAPAEPPVPAPGGLPWGTALATAGVALGASAGSGASTADGLPLPGALGSVTPGVAVGWLLVAAGVMLAAPGLAHLCGRVLAAGRPGAPRLLAGRALQREAARIGRPLGALCVAAAALLAALRFDGPGLFGPLGTLGACVVLGCVLGTVAAAAAEVRAARAATAETLRRLGAPRGLLRGVAALRIGVVAAAFGSLSWLAAELMLLPTGG
jgi:hypothetical protein